MGRFLGFLSAVRQDFTKPRPAHGRFQHNNLHLSLSRSGNQSQDTGALKMSIPPVLPSPGVVAPAANTDFGTRPPSPPCGFALQSPSSACPSSWLCSAEGCSPTCSPALCRRPAGRQEQDERLGQRVPCLPSLLGRHASVKAKSTSPSTAALRLNSSLLSACKSYLFISG